MAIISGQDRPAITYTYTQLNVHNKWPNTQQGNSNNRRGGVRTGAPEARAAPCPRRTSITRGPGSGAGRTRGVDAFTCSRNAAVGVHDDDGESGIVLVLRTETHGGMPPDAPQLPQESAAWHVTGTVHAGRLVTVIKLAYSSCSPATKGSNPNPHSNSDSNPAPNPNHFQRPI